MRLTNAVGKCCVLFLVLAHLSSSCPAQGKKDLLIRPSDNAADHEVGNWTVAKKAETHFTFTVPADFASLLTAEVIVLGKEDSGGPITYDLSMSRSGVGLLYGPPANQFVDLPATIVADTFLELDVTAIFPPVLVGDYLTLKFDADPAGDVHVLGLKFEYECKPPVLSFGVCNTRGGTNALLDNLTGFDNTAFGVDALRSNTTGSGNTASGCQALTSNATGAHNTAVGNLSLLDNTSGNYNTAVGYATLRSNLTGYQNTAIGYRAMRDNRQGYWNTAVGLQALELNTTGYQNTAIGSGALNGNRTGGRNTVIGIQAMSANITGSQNTASGHRALWSNTSGHNNTATGNQTLQSALGSRNIGIGYNAGFSLITGDDNILVGNQGVNTESGTIRIGTVGTHARTFIAGISGVTSAGGVGVFVNGSGELGTITSSRRFKEDIHDMADATDSLLKLRPVLFRYKKALPDGEKPIQYGLIAEEVAKLFPELVVFDEEGKPFTVKYNLLSSMLLNELQKQVKRDDAQTSQLDAQAGELEHLKAMARTLEARLASVESLTASPSKVVRKIR